MQLKTIDDLRDDDILWILGQAENYRLGATVPPKFTETVVGLVFLDASLRTHFGFASAVARLGGTSISVADRRANDVSACESIQDTLRVACGYSDIVVARLKEPFPLIESNPGVHLINGGDRGPRQEHPTQALIDLFALRRSSKPLDELVVALVGDLRMRAARSLLALLRRFPPKRILAVTSSALMDAAECAADSAANIEYGGMLDVLEADFIYMIGIPNGAIPDEERSSFRLTRELLNRLSPEAIVLSPMPIIDEIHSEARRDRRMQFLQQSDDGLYVRMSLIEFLVKASNRDEGR